MTDFTHSGENMKYYIIPKGFLVYRGDTAFYKRDSRPQRPFSPQTPFFFGTNVAEVEEYGVVFEFETTQEYKLLAIDDFETLEELYDLSPPPIQKILEKNYGYKSKIRDSIAEKDIAFSKWLCKKGYDGYAITNMVTDRGTKFHEELMICNAESIQFVKQITNNNIQPHIDKYDMLQMKKSMKTKKDTMVESRNGATLKRRILFTPETSPLSSRTPSSRTPSSQTPSSQTPSSRTPRSTRKTRPPTVRKLFGGKR